MFSKTVFISQPMRGKTDEEIMRERNAAIDHIHKSTGFPVVAVVSMIDKEVVRENNPLWCLGESLKRLSGVDAVYFVDGWENARGCRIERICAEQYGIPIIE